MRAVRRASVESSEAQPLPELAPPREAQPRTGQIENAASSMTFHRARLAERAIQAAAIEKSLITREKSAAIAAAKIETDALLLRQGYFTRQAILVQRQHQAVATALAERKKAHRAFAAHFGQKTIQLVRVLTREREAKDRAQLHMQPQLQATQTKAAKQESQRHERQKRQRRLEANQMGRMRARVQVEHALAARASHERVRLDTIRARVQHEHEIHEMLAHQE